MAVVLTGTVRSSVKVSLVALPRHRDRAENRFVRRFDPFQVADRPRADNDVLEGRLIGIEIDARQILIEPRADVAESDMILRFVADPIFPKRGRAACDPIAIARRRGLRENAVGEFFMAVIGQHAEKILRAGEADVQMIVVLLHVCREILDDRFLLLGRGQILENRAAQAPSGCCWRRLPPGLQNFSRNALRIFSANSA